MVELVEGTADGRGPLIPSDFAEAVQRIAEICGEFSLGGCGIAQYRATFPAWVGEDGERLKPPEVHVVQPEKIEGIFTAIYMRLKHTPEYRPLEAAIRERDSASMMAFHQRKRAEAAEALVTATREYWQAHASGDGDMGRLRQELDAAEARLESAKAGVERRTSVGG
jgi:hypothetical protein